MGSFNERFYTTDFDKEMMDFIEEVGYGVEDYEREWNVLHTVLAYAATLDGFWTETTNSPDEDYSAAGYTELTKQQFKEKIGMLEGNNTKEETFTKKDLVDGMFVKTREGEIHVVLGDIACDNKGFLDLKEDYNEDMLDIISDEGDDEYDIIEVFVKDSKQCLHEYLSGEGLKSIWKRTQPKSEKVIKLEQLISMHEEQLEATKKLLAEELDNV